MTSRKTSAAALLATMLLGVAATTASAKDYAQETTNLINFHLIDFIGWNNGNMDVMRKYHGSNVLVNMIGTRSVGIDPHVTALTQMLAGGAAKIVQHSPSLAQGEWTAVVGVTANGSMATIGKWKGGVLTEEHLFVRRLTTDQINAVDVSKPIVKVTTPNNAKLRAATGAEPGWSAVMVDGFAVFTQTTDSKVVRQLGFASK